MPPKSANDSCSCKRLLEHARRYLTKESSLARNVCEINLSSRHNGKWLHWLDIESIMVSSRFLADTCETVVICLHIF